MVFGRMRPSNQSSVASSEGVDATETGGYAKYNSSAEARKQPIKMVNAN